MNSRGGDRFDFPVGDAYLRFIHIHGYDNVKHMTSDEMDKMWLRHGKSLNLYQITAGLN